MDIVGCWTAVIYICLNAVGYLVVVPRGQTYFQPVTGYVQTFSARMSVVRVVLLILSAVLLCGQISCLTPGVFTESRQVKHNSHGDPTDEWAYVMVRSYAHMFYWLYYTTNPAGYKNTPLVLWLQGGPGGSSTGFGNFMEIGPMDVEQKPRNTTWLSEASLLFVDNPVGSGFSYVDNDSAYTKNVDEIAADMFKVLDAFFTNSPLELQTVPFYIFSESYGGKMTAAISAVLNKAMHDGTIKCNFKGFAMGDSWISPVDSTMTWGPYLYTNSLVDKTQEAQVMYATTKVQDAIKQQNWTGATNLWGAAQEVVGDLTNGVNWYNILMWGAPPPGLNSKKASNLERMLDRVLGPLHADPLSALMNGPVRKHLKIIPDKVTWGGQSGEVFVKQTEDFMKPVIEIVDDLIQHTNLSVVVYNAQLDLIVDTMGTEKWVYGLTSAPDFMKAERKPILDPVTKLTSGYVKTSKNFSFYWILSAGHMVPMDNGSTALEMLKMVLSNRSR